MSDDKDLAAALLVALEAALISHERAINVIDHEIAHRPEPASWLLDAALTTDGHDLLGILRGPATGHPLLTEVWPLLLAMERSLANGTDPLEVARQVSKMYPYGSWPKHLDQALYDVYEEVNCAHAHGGVPQRRNVEEALRTLFLAGRGDRRCEDLVNRILK